MSVASEVIVAALEDLLKLEELAVGNLAEVGCYDFSCFSKAEQKVIQNLFKKLREDTGEHAKKIIHIMERLNS